MGIVFAENGELSNLELFMYYLEHSFAAIIAPLILYLGGRYTPSYSAKWPLPLFGFALFCVYMRYFLAPISAITWTNLNHTLCGIDTDPWRVEFGMHKYSYFWAEFYLLPASFTSFYLNYAIGRCLCQDTASDRKLKDKI